ncbi:MAG: hypothetical protein QM690_06760 [Sphingobium sp.]
MLELTPTDAATPAAIHAKLAMARRVVDVLTSPADRRKVEEYIVELERELLMLRERH